MDSNLERTKEKLETETARHAETKQKLAEIEGETLIHLPENKKKQEFLDKKTFNLIPTFLN